MARYRRPMSGKFIASAVGAGVLLATYSGHGAAVAHHVTVAAAGPVPSGTLSCAGLETLWEDAGGPPSAAVLAASVAMAESGGNQYAYSPAGDVGYWQINAPIWGTGLATTDPLGNARAAVQISHDGTDWNPWTTYDQGLEAGRC